MKTKKVSECCPLFPLIIRRDVLRDTRRGFELNTPFQLSTGKMMPEVVIYRFPKRKRTEPADELEDATYALVRFCPFCGAPQERKKDSK